MYESLTDKELEYLYIRFSEKSFDENINAKYRELITNETFIIIREISRRKHCAKR